MNSKDFLKEGFVEDATDVHMDHEVQMAREECYHAAEHALAIHKLLRNISEQQGLEGWVSSKITLANDYLNTVREHLEYELLQPQIDDVAIGMPIAENEQQGVAEGMEGQVVFSGSGADGGKYEIIQTGPTDFMIHANGKHIDTYSSLQRAMSVLKNEVPGLNKGVAEGSKPTKKEYLKKLDQNRKDIEDIRKQGTYGAPGSLKNVDWVKKQGVAEGSGKNVVKSVKVGNFRHDLVDTGFGWQVRIYNGDELYDTGMSKNSEQKGLSALEDAVAYTEKQLRTKRQGVAEGNEQKYRVTYDIYSSNREKPLYTNTRTVRASSEEEAIKIIRDLIGGRNHRIEKGVAEGSLNEGQYEMMMRNGRVKKFVAKDDADAKRIAAGHGAKSVIRLKGGVPAGKVAEQGVVEAKLTGKYKPKRTALEKFRDSMKKSGYDMDDAARRLEAFLAKQKEQRAELDAKYADMDFRAKNKDKTKALSEWRKQQRVKKIREQGVTDQDIQQRIQPTFQATDAQINDPDWMRARGLVPMQDIEAGIKTADEQGQALNQAQQAGFPTYQHQGQTYGVMNPKYGKGGSTGQPKPLTPQQIQQTAGTNIVSGSGAPVTAGSKMLTPNQRMGGVNETTAGSVAGVVNPKSSKPKNQVGSLFGGTYTQKRKGK